MALYRIKDILYQNNGKGPYMTSKVGEKHDRRRGHVFDLNRSQLNLAQPYIIDYVGCEGWIMTTPVVGITEINETILHLETVNSIYVLEKIEQEENNE